MLSRSAYFMPHICILVISSDGLLGSMSTIWFNTGSFATYGMMLTHCSWCWKPTDEMKLKWTTKIKIKIKKARTRTHSNGCFCCCSWKMLFCFALYVTLDNEHHQITHTVFLCLFGCSNQSRKQKRTSIECVRVCVFELILKCEERNNNLLNREREREKKATTATNQFAGIC